MANDRNRMDEYAGPEEGRSSDSSEERVRHSGLGEEVDLVLGDGDPVAGAELLSFGGAKGVEILERAGHGHSLRTKRLLSPAH